MQPPKYLEKLLHWLLPPACREHVLGDLQERNTSPKSYVLDALSVLIPVVVSRIRRTTDIQVFLMEAISIYMSFAMAAWYLGERAGFVRLTIPAAVTVVCLLFCNAYSSAERKRPLTPVLQSAGSLSVALLSQSAFFNNHWPVQPSVLLYGSALALLLLSPLRTFFPHRIHPLQKQPVAAASFVDQTGPKRNITLIFLAALAAAAVLLLPLLRGAFFIRPSELLAALALIVFVLYQIRIG
jgi:hypothetical protein